MSIDERIGGRRAADASPLVLIRHRRTHPDERRGDGVRAMRLRVPPPPRARRSACAISVSAPFFSSAARPRQRRLAPALGVRPRQKRLDDARRRPRRGTRLGVTPRVPGVPGVTGTSVLFDGSFRLSHLERDGASSSVGSRARGCRRDAGHPRASAAAAGDGALGALQLAGDGGDRDGHARRNTRSPFSPCRKAARRPGVDARRVCFLPPTTRKRKSPKKTPAPSCGGGGGGENLPEAAPGGAASRYSSARSPSRIAAANRASQTRGRGPRRHSLPRRGRSRPCAR